MLIEELSDNEWIRLGFTGTLPDFEDIQQVKAFYPSIELEHIPVEEANDKFRN